MNNRLLRALAWRALLGALLLPMLFLTVCAVPAGATVILHGPGALWASWQWTAILLSALGILGLLAAAAAFFRRIGDE